MNDILRFALELASLAAIGRGAYLLSGGNWIVAAGAPLAAAVLWTVFAVPGDPSRSGRAPVAVPGWLRLVLELCVFAAGAASLLAAGEPKLAGAMIAPLVVHHVLAWRRLRWLLVGR